MDLLALLAPSFFEKICSETFGQLVSIGMLVEPLERSVVDAGPPHQPGLTVELCRVLEIAKASLSFFARVASLLRRRLPLDAPLAPIDTQDRAAQPNDASDQICATYKERERGRADDQDQYPE